MPPISSYVVITQEDIRRSGATSLPEALRVAPDLQVAQIDSRQWAISARGLVDQRHAEFGAAATRQEIERSSYGKVTWRF
jgi:iron complex outermembrane receptor protein